MSDSFFGFDANEPAFGLDGKEKNDLVEAGEDDQIDQFNDETFGDLGEDAAWNEDEHEKLTEKSGFHNGNGQAYPGYGTQEDDLEQSLNRLVVDDDDEPTGLPIGQGSRGIPIGRGNANLDNLFGPASPPGFLHTESLVSPGRQNVWGSPMRGQFTTQHQEDNLHNLLKVLQPQGQATEFQDPAIVNAGKPMPGNLPPARTLNNLESNLDKSHGGKVHAFTVEELEKQLQQGRKVPSPPSSGFPLPIGTPPGPTVLQDLTRMPPPLPRMPPPHMQGHSRGSPGLGPSGMQTTNITSILQRPPPSDTQQGQQTGRDFGGSAKTDRPPPPHMMGNFLQNAGTPVQQRMPFPMGHSDPTHNKFYQGRGGHNMGRGGVDPRQGLFNSQQRKHTVYNPSKYDQQMMGGGDNKDTDNMRNYSNNMRGGPGGQRGRGGGGRGGYHHYNNNRDSPHHYNRDNQSMDEDDNKDEYANLMTKKEKDWIIKIQLMQLQTDNPYLDDFYFTTWQMNKKAEELRKKEMEKGKKSSQQPKLVLPQMSKLDNKSYKPIQFEGSLGRLTASSVHNPRKIIDIGARRNSESEDAKGKEMRRYKSLLVDIEMSYNLLLTIDDLDKKGLALPEEARGPLIEERTNKIDALYGRLNCKHGSEEAFGRLVTVRKGIKLVTRTIPLLNHAQAEDAVAAVLYCLGTISRKEYQDEILPPLFNNIQDVINEAPLAILVRFADELRRSSTDTNKTNSIVTALQNKFGASVIWCLVNRGEVVYTSASPLEMTVEHQSAWVKFVITVSETVSSLSKDSLATTQNAFKLVPSHLERVLDKRSFVTVEDILEKVVLGPKVGNNA